MDIRLPRLPFLLFSLGLPATAAEWHVVWKKTFEPCRWRSSAPMAKVEDGFITGIQVAEDSGQEQIDIRVVKHGFDGAFRWSRMVGSPDRQDWLHSLEPDTGGGFLLAGRWMPIGYSPATDNPTSWAGGFDREGAPRWSRSYATGSRDAMMRIRRLPDGGFIAAGTRRTGGWLARLDAAGDTVWTRSRETNGYESWLSDAWPLPGGGFIAAGSLWYASPDGRQSMAVRGFGSGGDSLWDQSLGYRQINSAESLLPLSSGDFLAVGYTYHSLPEVHRMPTAMRLGPDGTLAWFRQYEFGDSFYEVSQALEWAPDRFLLLVANDPPGRHPDPTRILEIDGDGDSLELHTFPTAAWERFLHFFREGNDLVLSGSVWEESSNQSRALLVRLSRQPPPTATRNLRKAGVEVSPNPARKRKAARLDGRRMGN